MPTVGFEPTISAGEQPQTHALERAATGTVAVRWVPDHINQTNLVNVHVTCNLISAESKSWVRYSQLHHYPKDDKLTCPSIFQSARLIRLTYPQASVVSVNCRRGVVVTKWYVADFPYHKLCAGVPIANETLVVHCGNTAKTPPTLGHNY